MRKARTKALPISIPGANGLSFQLLGMLHPRLRTAALPAELLNKRGKVVEVRIGSPIEYSTIDAVRNDQNATAYLRLRSELLGSRTAAASDTAVAQAPIAPAPAPETLRAEIESLPADCLLVASNDFGVYVARAAQIPRVLQEIGRLREITFRAAGEGSGEPLDLDRFDDFYLHLFVWRRRTDEIVGAYRLGEIPQILSRYGSRGLYTKSLFHFQPGYFRRLGCALELGRSFVRLEYQRQFAPLLLLWKGIGRYVFRNPEYKILVGAVSVSNQYSPVSRELIAGYFERGNGSDGSAGSWLPEVWARHKLKGSAVQKWERASLCKLIPSVDDLSAPISDLEADGKGVPVLVKQYVRLGGKLLAFSVDPTFGNTLDAFVRIDLTQTSPETLARYMGKEESRSFLAWHTARAESRAA